MQFRVCISVQMHNLIRSRTEGRGLYVTPCLSTYRGYRFGKGVNVDTLAAITKAVWRIIWMLPEKDGIMWATT